jgi:hypothetical protein
MCICSIMRARECINGQSAPRTNDSGHLPGRKVCGNDDKVSKGASTKQRPVVTANATRLVSQETMDPTKLSIAQRSVSFGELRAASLQSESWR